jgi:predicted CoA-binding protein
MMKEEGGDSPMGETIQAHQQSALKPTVAVVGASADRSKYGNKAVRAYTRAGYTVYPVNPNMAEVEGLTAYPNLGLVPVDRLDRVSYYVPPEVGLQVLEQLGGKPIGELWLNPGADAPRGRRTRRDARIERDPRLQHPRDWRETGSPLKRAERSHVSLADQEASGGRMQVLAIIALCIGSAVIYGIVHDQITARVCIEYFTIGHPPVFPTESPTWLGIGWGIIATWWVGLLLGIPLAVAARAGRQPKRSAWSLFQPIFRLLVCMAISAFVAGLMGFFLGRAGVFSLIEPLASRVPREKHVWFLANLWAHDASYLIGFVGGIVVIVRVWMGRGRDRDLDAQLGHDGSKLDVRVSR